MIKEITFWKLQIEEHMLFIYQGLVEDVSCTNFKKQAALLHQLWHSLARDVLCLVEETLIFQYRLLHTLINGPWIGFLSASFVQHMITETEYFKIQLTGCMSREDQIKFWYWHHKTEFAATKKLLDPSEEQLSKRIKEYIEYIKVLENDVVSGDVSPQTQHVLDEYLQQTTDLQQGILCHQIKSNISPILINHAIREGYYALALFNNLSLDC